MLCSSKIRSYLKMSKIGELGKLVCVGWNKTGTTSMGCAFRELGFNHWGYCHPELKKLAKGDLESIFRRARKHQSFDDWPWHFLYKELDAEFPGSKFVHTVRDPDEWLVSYRKWREANHKGIEGHNMVGAQRAAYGKPYLEMTDGELLSCYERRLAEVRLYFAMRPKDYLEIDIKDFSSHGWDKLCSFLELDKPDSPFPHNNHNP